MMSTSTVDQEASLKALLDEKQIATLLKLLGTRCVILSIARLKVFSITVPPEHVQWKRRKKCIATIVKECHKDSGVEVVLLNLDKKKIYWEKAMPSTELEYKLIKPLFHLILDVDEGMVGLNFHSADEATAFANVLTKYLACDERRSSMSTTSDSDSGKLAVEVEDSHQTTDHEKDAEKGMRSSDSTANNSQAASTSAAHSKFSLFKGKLKVPIISSPKSGQKSKLGKERISSAYDFAHIHHMAYDSEKAGFTYDYLDAAAKYNIFKVKKDIFSGQNLEKLLEAAGVTQSELNGEETMLTTSNDESEEDEEADSSDNLDETPKEEKSAPKLKISTDSENLELNKIMSELKVYQRESYYNKDLSIPLTPKIVDFQPTFDKDEEDEEEKEDFSKEEEDAFSKAPATAVRKDLFAQIGVDAMKAFQNRSLRMTSTDSTTTKVVDEGEKSTVSSIPMPAPRRSKFFPSNENVILDETSSKEEKEEEFRENLI